MVILVAGDRDEHISAFPWWELYNNKALHASISADLFALEAVT